MAEPQWSGLIPGGLDPRNANYPIIHSGQPLQSVRWTKSWGTSPNYANTVLNQNQCGMCVGFAAYNTMLYYPNHISLSPQPNAITNGIGVPLVINTSGTPGVNSYGDKIYPTTQSPTYGHAEAVAIFDEGYKLYRNNPSATPPRDPNSGIFLQSGVQAMVNRGWVKSYRWASDFDQFLDGCTQGPMMVGIFSIGGSPSRTSSPIGHWFSSSAMTGHALVIDEIDVLNERLYFNNSYGSSWGPIYGRAWMTFEEFYQKTSVHVDHPFAAVLMNPASTFDPTLENIEVPDTNIVSNVTLFPNGSNGTLSQSIPSQWVSPPSVYDTSCPEMGCSVTLRRTNGRELLIDTISNTHGYVMEAGYYYYDATTFFWMYALHIPNDISFNVGEQLALDIGWWTHYGGLGPDYDTTHQNKTFTIDMTGKKLQTGTVYIYANFTSSDNRVTWKLNTGAGNRHTYMVAPFTAAALEYDGAGSVSFESIISNGNEFKFYGSMVDTVFPVDAVASIFVELTGVPATTHRSIGIDTIDIGTNGVSSYYDTATSSVSFTTDTIGNAIVDIGVTGELVLSIDSTGIPSLYDENAIYYDFTASMYDPVYEAVGTTSFVLSTIASAWVYEPVLSARGSINLSFLSEGYVPQHNFDWLSNEGDNLSEWNNNGDATGTGWNTGTKSSITWLRK